jgi:hypothetical protein
MHTTPTHTAIKAHTHTYTTTHQPTRIRVNRHCTADVRCGDGDKMLRDAFCFAIHSATDGGTGDRDPTGKAFMPSLLEYGVMLGVPLDAKRSYSTYNSIKGTESSRDIRCLGVGCLTDCILCTIACILCTIAYVCV